MTGVGLGIKVWTFGRGVRWRASVGRTGDGRIRVHYRYGKESQDEEGASADATTQQRSVPAVFAASARALTGFSTPASTGFANNCQIGRFLSKLLRGMQTAYD